MQLHRTIDRVVERRVAERAQTIKAEAVAAAVAEVRYRGLREHQVFGPVDRLSIAPSAAVNDALFNTVSGRIIIADDVFFGHGVAVLTGSHDIEVTGPSRGAAIPTAGNDVTIGTGAWVSSRAMVLGPCRIGDHAVIAAGAVVTTDVPAGAVVAGVPARVVSTVDVESEFPAALNILTDVGPIFAHAHDEVITPVLRDAGGMPDQDLALLRDVVAEGATVVDIGANIGYSTLRLAQLVGARGRVIAVEPHPANLRLLRANVARNGMRDRVTVVAGAAMAEAGTVLLAESSENTGDHRVRPDAGQRTSLSVQGLVLDEVLDGAGPIALMLLDTQGTEHHAIAGAHQVISRDRPTLLVEFWPHGILGQGDEPAAVLGGYRDAGFSALVLEDPSLDGLDDDALAVAVDARPGASGGFVTLRLDPR